MSLIKLRSLGIAIALAAGPGLAAAQPPGASVEARLRALEARVSALEGGKGIQAPPADGVPCRKVELSGRWIPSDAPLTVRVNGTTIGTYDGNAVQTGLDGFMRAGPNMVQLSFAAPGSPQTEVALRCMPPAGNDWAEILRLRPHGGRRTAESQITIVR